MAERKIVIDRDISKPSVPTKNEKPRMEKVTEPDDTEETTAIDIPKKKEIEIKPLPERGVKKDSFLTKLKRQCFGDKTIGEALEDGILDWVVPGIKYSLFDGFFNSMSLYLFNQPIGRIRERERDRERSTGTNYARMYRSRDREERLDRDDIGEVWEHFDPPMTRDQCREVIMLIRDIAEQNGYVTRAQFLRKCGAAKLIQYTDHAWCWRYEDLRSDKIDIYPVRGRDGDGFAIHMPRVRPTPSFDDDDDDYRRRRY